MTQAENDAIRAARWQEWLLIALGATLWLAAFPYRGIYHDARVYTLMAMAVLKPEWFAHEIFLGLGRQSGLSVFPWLHAHLVGWLGISDASKALVLCGGLVWVAACRLLTRLLPWMSGAFAFLLLVGVWLPYHPSFRAYDFFSVAENFSTPRIWAASLVLAGLSFQLGGRRHAMAFAAAGLACLVHPLIGIWGLLAVLLVRWCQECGYLFWYLTPLFFVVLTLTTLAPESWRMEAGWLSVVRATDQSAFPGSWTEMRYGHFAWMLGVILLAARHGSERLQPLYAVAAWLFSLGLVGYAWLEVVPIALFVQVQPWRVSWLATIVAVLAISELGLRALNRSDSRRGWWMLLVGTFFVREIGGGWVGVAVLVSAIAERAALRCGVLPGWKSRKQWIRSGVVAATVLMALAWTIDRILEVDILGDGWSSTSGFEYWLTGFFRRGGFGLVPVLAFLIWLTLKKATQWHRVAAVLSVAVCLATAIVLWDARPLKIRQYEAGYGHESNRPFGSRIAHGDVVLWLGDPKLVWFGLGTANYLSHVQAFASIFSWPLAKEIEYRIRRLSELFARPGSTEPMPTDGHNLIKQIVFAMLQGERVSVTGLRAICGKGGPDWVVLDSNLAGLAVAEMEMAVVRSTVVRYFLFNCHALRPQATSG